MTVFIPPPTSKDSGVAHRESSDMSLGLDATRTIHDDASDYSDFTLDEQEIIDELLANIAPATVSGEGLLELTDIEDYEEPRGVHLPKTLGKELWVPPWMQQQQPRAQVTIEDTPSRDISTTNGKKSPFPRMFMPLTC